MTGEEKITPPKARYSVCTVEAMPQKADVAFVAIDEVQLAGERVTLTEREFRLVSLFFSHPGELLSRAHLLEVVWGIKGDVSTRTVDTHISRLRRKLVLDGSHGVRLRSIYQHGYRLEAQAMRH